MVSFSGDLSGNIDLDLAKVGRRRRVVLGVPQFSGLRALLAGTEMVATVPDYAACALADDGSLRADPAPFDITEAELSMVWSGAQDNDPAERWLREFLHESRALGHACVRVIHGKGLRTAEGARRAGYAGPITFLGAEARDVGRARAVFPAPQRLMCEQGGAGLRADIGQGAGGLYSSVHDLAKWMNVQLAGGVYAGSGNNAYAHMLRQEQPGLIQQFGEFGRRHHGFAPQILDNPEQPVGPSHVAASSRRLRARLTRR